MGVVTSINAVTLHTTDMGLSIAFYVAMGFRISFGDPDASFTTVTSGDCFVNLWLVESDDEVNHSWGRIIFHVDNVDIRHAMPHGVKEFFRSTTQWDMT